MPVVNDFLGTGIKAANMLADWTAKHPGLAKAIISAVSSLLAFRIGLFGAMVVGNRAKAVFLSLKGAYLSLKSAATLTQAVMQGGMSLADVPGRLGSVMRAFSAARTAMLGFSVSSLVAMWPIVLVVAAIAAAAFLIYKYWGPVKSFFIGIWEGIKEGFAPTLPLLEAFWNGLKELGAVVAEVFEPVIGWFDGFLTANTEASAEAQNFGRLVGAVLGGLLAAVVQIGAMIVDGWRMIFDLLFSTVANVWTQIKAAFSGGLTGILGLILNWSPLGAFYSAFAPVLSWFGVTLPARFTQFGANIISGLWNGLKAKFEEVKAWFSGVAGWFAVKFQNSNEIKSPSRLFKRFGGWMMEGLQIGLGNGSARPLAAIGSVASDLQQRFKNRSGSLSAELAASMQANSAEFAAARQAQTGGGVTIHFNPTINASGGVDANQLLDLLRRFSGDELQRLVVEALNRHQEDLARRAY